MLYYLVRPVARFVLRHYFRQIDITGLDNIPRNGAVVLAANHPTAFIEPCILACFQPRTLRFLARGNLYASSLAGRVLRALHVLPVYRLEDGGFGKLKENFGTFAECNRALSRRRAIMILAEGRCIHEKALRPLRKGTARIALGALDADITLPEVHIVPVGINFTYADRVRSTVMIRCGKPIPASAYLEAYRSDPNPALRQLTQHLRERLDPLVVQHRHPAAAGTLELRLAWHRALHQTHLITGVTHSGEQLDGELLLAEETNVEPVAERVATHLYRTKLPLTAAAGQVTERAMVEKRPAGLLMQGLVGAGLQLPLMPIWLLGQITARLGTNHVEFFSPVRFATICIGYLVFVPLLLFTLPWLGKVWVLLALFMTGWSLRCWESWNAFSDQATWNSATPRDRQVLINGLEQVEKTYAE